MVARGLTAASAECFVNPPFFRRKCIVPIIFNCLPNSLNPVSFGWPMQDHYI